MKEYISKIANLIEIENVSIEEIKNSIIVSTDKEKADYTLPCFKFSKTLKLAPQVIAQNLCDKLIDNVQFEKIEAVNGYLNFKLNTKEIATRIFGDSKNIFNNNKKGKGKTICIDYSSVNIAKPFHIGHLSTTVIGAALDRIHRHLGYNVVAINHLGDWGTQFGKLIVAYKMWGDKPTIDKGGIKALLDIYIKYHDEAEKDKSLDEKSREWFKKIENGDSEAMELFLWFKDITLKEVSKIYDTLGIKFDSYNGESFYNDKMDSVISELEEKNILTTSENAKVVDLEKYNMPPCLLVKGDGATLYATRDLAAVKYRKAEYDFHKCLYVVAYQQNLHFKQLFKVVELMGHDYYKDLIHVPFGMVSYEGKPLSTRKGHVVFLQEVLDSAVEKALDIITVKNPNLENKEDIARKVGVGAVTFSALHSSRIKDIDFSYERVLSFEGETAPYVQYTFARCNSVLAKSKITKKVDYNMTEIEKTLIKQLANLPEIIENTTTTYEPSQITRHIIDICKTYNKFYFDNRIIGDDEGIQNFRLKLTKATMDAISVGFGLLGIELPEKM